MVRAEDLDDIDVVIYDDGDVVVYDDDDDDGDEKDTEYFIIKVKRYSVSRLLCYQSDKDSSELVVRAERHDCC